MTIKTKEAEVITDLPPAKLFLEDIEEIVRVFRDAAPGEEDVYYGDKDAAVELKLEIGEKVCDDVQDLPKIRKKTNDLSIEVRRGTSYRVSLHVANHGSSWFWSGMTDDVAWQTFRRLQGVFNARKLRWRALIHSIPLEAALFASVLWLVMGPLIWFILRAIISNKSAAVSSFVLTSILTISFFMARFRHTTVILRHSSERAAIREDTLQKIVPPTIAAILAFIGGIVLMILKHKYWP